MGHIYEDHGKIAVEGRRESFYVHAGYGYRQATRPVGDLHPGDEFDYRGGRCKLYALFADHALVLVDAAEPDRVELTELVGIDDQEFDETEPLGRVWREHPHPEFAIEDLDDLIAALTEYREAIR